MTRPPFSAIDFPLYDSLPIKDLLPILEKPTGISQVVAIGKLLRRCLNREDRKKFDNMSLSQFMRLMNDYMEMSAVMGEMKIERYTTHRKEIDGLGDESNSG
jgi:hypothetical protein